jgi:uncharacterized protein (DUF4415 family)
VIPAGSWHNNENHFVSTAEIHGKLYTVIWMWRRENQRIISFRRARMAKRGRIVRYTAEELAEKGRRGETHSDWATAAAITSEEIEAQMAADPDEAGMVVDWDSVTVELPKPKADLHMRVDRDVLDYFRGMGKGYQTRINAVLRSYVERRRHD